MGREFRIKKLKEDRKKGDKTSAIGKYHKQKNRGGKLTPLTDCEKNVVGEDHREHYTQC